MEKYLLFIVTISAFTFVSSSEFKRYFIDRAQNFSDFKAYAHDVTESITNLTTTTPEDKFELGIMGYEFADKIRESILYLNRAVLNIADENFRAKLSAAVNKLSEIVNRFQHELHSTDTDKTKKKLAGSVSGVIEVGESIVDILKENEDKIPPTVFNPLQIAIHRALFSVHQLKQQSRLFKKNNDEVAKEVKNSLTTFMKTLTGIKTESVDLRKELVYQIIQLEHIVDKAVLKLETWTSLNANETDSIRSIKEASVEMSALYERLHRLANSHHTVSYIAGRFGPFYRDFNMLIKNIGRSQMDQTAGNLEYIKTILVNAIAVSDLYGEELGQLSKSGPSRNATVVN